MGFPTGWPFRKKIPISAVIATTNVALNLLQTAYTASSQQVGFEAYRAFNGNFSPIGSYWASAATPSTQWITVDMTVKRKITKLVMQNANTYGVNSFKLRGSNDNAAWTDIYTSSMPNNTVITTFIFPNTNQYRYYRVEGITYWSGTYMQMWEIEMHDLTPPSSLLNYQARLDITKIQLDNKCNDNFSDLRFTSNDKVTIQPYYIENLVVGISATIWIKIDNIPPDPSTTDIYIYYGNLSAASSSDSDSTFPQTGIYHMDEASWNGSPGEIIDTVGNSNGQSFLGANTITDGFLNRAGRFDGTDDYASIPGVDIQIFIKKIIVQFYLRIPSTPSGYASYPISKALLGEWTNNNYIGQFVIYLYGTNSDAGEPGKLRVLIGDINDNTNKIIASAYSPVLSLNTWIKIRWDYDYLLGGKLAINDIEQTPSRVGSGKLRLSISTYLLAFLINTSSGRPSSYYNGDLDELNISGVIYNIAEPQFGALGNEEAVSSISPVLGSLFYPIGKGITLLTGISLGRKRLKNR